MLADRRGREVQVPRRSVDRARRDHSLQNEQALRLQHPRTIRRCRTVARDYLLVPLMRGSHHRVVEHVDDTGQVIRSEEDDGGATGHHVRGLPSSTLAEYDLTSRP